MDVDSVLHDLGFTNIGGDPIREDVPRQEIEHEFRLKHGKMPEIILQQKSDDDGRR